MIRLLTFNPQSEEIEHKFKIIRSDQQIIESELEALCENLRNSFLSENGSQNRSHNHPEGLDYLLTNAFRNRQHSEKWVMYRVVVPIVDTLLRSEEFHEFDTHFEVTDGKANTSADLVVRSTSKPKALVIETKHLDKRIYGNELDKYLSNGETGVVTDGATWLFCKRDKSGWQYRKIDLFSKAGLNLKGLSELEETLSQLLTNPQYQDGFHSYDYESSPLSGKRLRPAIPQLVPFSKKFSKPIATGDSEEDILNQMRELSINGGSIAFAKALLQGGGNLPNQIRFELKEDRFTGHFPPLHPGAARRIFRVRFKDSHIIVSKPLYDLLSGSERSLSVGAHNQTGSFREFKQMPLEDCERLGKGIRDALASF